MTAEAIQSVAYPNGAEAGRGVAPPDAFKMDGLQEFTAANLEDVIRRFAESVEAKPNLLALARILGLTYCVGTVSATQDTEFLHDSRRQLALVVHSVSLDGNAGVVAGCSTGGANVMKWSATSIYVRATIAGRYAFFVM